MTTLHTVLLWITGVERKEFWNRLEREGIHYISFDYYDARSFTLAVSESDAIILRSWNGEVGLTRDAFPQILSVSRKTLQRGERITDLKAFLATMDGCVLKAYINSATSIEEMLGQESGWDYFQFTNFVGKIETMLIRSTVYERAVNLRWEYFLRKHIPDRRLHFLFVPIIFSPSEPNNERLLNLLRQHFLTPKYWRIVGNKIWQMPVKIWSMLEMILPKPDEHWDRFLIGDYRCEPRNIDLDHGKIQYLTYTIEQTFRKFVVNTSELQNIDWVVWAIETLLSRPVSAVF